MGFTPEQYLEKQKSHFDADGWWGTPDEMAEDENLNDIWLQNHTYNKEYWDILYGDLKDKDRWSDATAMDYGCGFGGNMHNLLGLDLFKRVYGIDFSPKNVRFTKDYLRAKGHSGWHFRVYENDGMNIPQLKDESIDFATSIVTFQHISLHSVRKKINEEIYRCLKEGGVFSFQMKGGRQLHVNGYYANFYKGSGRPRCIVDNPQYVISDLEDIGFKNVTYEYSDNESGTTKDWIYFRAEK